MDASSPDAMRKAAPQINCNVLGKPGHVDYAVVRRAALRELEQRAANGRRADAAPTAPHSVVVSAAFESGLQIGNTKGWQSGAGFGFVGGLFGGMVLGGGIVALAIRFAITQGLAP